MKIHTRVTTRHGCHQSTEKIVFEICLSFDFIAAMLPVWSMDYKPLIHAFNAKLDRYILGDFGHFDYISQLTRNIRYVGGADSLVTDTISRRSGV